MLHKRIGLFCTAIFLSSPVLAQSIVGEGFNTAVEAVQDGIDLIWPDKLNIKGANVRMGVGFGFTPDYVGSDDYKLRFVPLIDIRYKDTLHLNGSRLTYSLYNKGDFSAGPLVNLRFGRSEKQNALLEGFGDIGTTLEVGGFARYKTDKAIVSVEYRHGLGAGVGGSILATLGHGIYKNGRFSALFAARGRWMSKKTMQTNFGLTEAQSAASVAGLPSFNAGAGIAEVTANLVGSFELNSQVRLLGLVSYGRLTADAARSPIVTDGTGSSTQMLSGVGLAIAF